MHMEENERRNSGKTQTKMSGCYMTNTEVEMLQEVKKEKDDNKKDKKKGEEMKDDEEEQKKKVRNTNISQNSVSHMLRQRG
jgi:hypothetical protein